MEKEMTIDEFADKLKYGGRLICVKAAYKTEDIISMVGSISHDENNLTMCEITEGMKGYPTTYPVNSITPPINKIHNLSGSDKTKWYVGFKIPTDYPYMAISVGELYKFFKILTDEEVETHLDMQARESSVENLTFVSQEDNIKKEI